MNGINEGYFFVIGKIIELQTFFLKEAWVIGRVVFLISLCSAIVNFAMTQTGLKENIVKMIKALVFFVLVMRAYPRIVDWITQYTFNLASGSSYATVQAKVNSMMVNVYAHAQIMKAKDKKSTYPNIVLTQDTNFFSPMIATITNSQTGQQYSSIAPAAVLNAMVLVAGACIHAADDYESQGMFDFTAFGIQIKGIICALCVVISGSFAVLEYLVSFMEFIFVTSVGIICFPLSLWDGTKFMSEKFISAIFGFFFKLLFSSICIFITLYGFLTLATLYTTNPFLGLIDQIVMVIFTCLMFYYLSKSAPALAQSLLTGAPSLTAAGAVGTAVTAFGAIAGIAHRSANLDKGGVSPLSKSLGASSDTVKDEKERGGNALVLIGSGVDTARSAGNGLTRSLVSRSSIAGQLGNSSTQQLINSTSTLA